MGLYNETDLGVTIGEDVHVAEGSVGGLNSLDVSESNASGQFVQFNGTKLILLIMGGLAAVLLLMAALIHILEEKPIDTEAESSLRFEDVKQKEIPLHCRLGVNMPSGVLDRARCDIIKKLVYNAWFGYSTDDGCSDDNLKEKFRPIWLNDVSWITNVNDITADDIMVFDDNFRCTLSSNSQDVQTAVAAIKKLVTDVKDSEGDYQTISLAAKEFRNSTGLSDEDSHKIRQEFNKFMQHHKEKLFI